MRAVVTNGFVLSLLFSFSTAWLLTDFKSHFLWKVHFSLIPVLENPFLFVDASPPPEEVTKLKEKIKEGKKLLEELNDNLEKIKESLNDKKDPEKAVLDSIIDIKNKFTELKVDPDDLSKDLIKKFHEKVVEAFKLIMKSYGLDQIVKQKNVQQQADVKAGDTDEIKAEDTDDKKVVEEVQDVKQEL